LSAHTEMFALDRAGLDRDAPSSLHSQLSDSMRSAIVAGHWPPGQRLSSEPDLAAELGVSRGTLRRAIATLVDEGLLRQVRGRGTFVTEPVLEPAIGQRLSTLTEDFASQGVVLDTAVLESSLVTAPKAVAAVLRIPAGVPALRLVRVRSTAGEPIALVKNYVRTDLAPGIESTDFTAESLFGVLEGRFALRIGTARRTFSAEGCSGEVAAALGLEEGHPVQYLEQLTFLADGRPVECSDVWIDSTRLRVVTRLSRR